ncbi:ABC transporter A, ABCA [Kipferlia bialata]|uniref:ABC transporter A, ABCA n=1 Tax=Kipferlia bialata TaxID=797122 RepID=A0A9K3CUZ2_9EUKA|nr:ABC transporter A, ABCA [Kipferlia bialata]|eukprot:g3165.t1
MSVVHARPVEQALLPEDALSVAPVPSSPVADSVSAPIQTKSPYLTTGAVKDCSTVSARGPSSPAPLSGSDILSLLRGLSEMAQVCCRWAARSVFGVSMPEYSRNCHSLSVSPSTPLTHSLVSHMLEGWGGDSGMGDVLFFDTQPDLEAYASDNPGLLSLGVSFTSDSSLDVDASALDPPPLDILSSLQWVMHYNSTLTNPNMYAILGQDDLAGLDNIFEFSSMTLRLQHAVDRALVKQWTGVDYTPQIKAWPFYNNKYDGLPGNLETCTLIYCIVAVQFLLSLNAVAAERDGGQLAALRLMGQADWVYYLSWFVVQGVVYTATLVPCLASLYLFPDNTIFTGVSLSASICILLVAGAAATALGLCLASFFVRLGTAMVAGVLFLAGGLVGTAYLCFLEPGYMYDVTFIGAGLSRALRWLTPFYAFNLLVASVYIQAMPYTTVDPDTYALLVVPSETPFTFGSLFGLGGAYTYPNDKLQCIGAVLLTDCKVDVPASGTLVLLMLVQTLVYLTLGWVVSEWSQTCSSAGRTPWQLLSRQYWAVEPPLPEQQTHRRTPATKAQVHAVLANQPHADSAVREETRYILRQQEHPGARLVVHSLQKTFRRVGGGYHRAVTSMSMRLKKGQIYCLLGHNGCGKTTTINMLLGVLPPDPSPSASVGQAWLCDGLSVRHDMNHIRRRLGVCSQHNTSIWPGMTARQHLRLVCRMHAVPRFEVAHLIEQSLRSVALWDNADKPAGQYSGGMMRRLCIAMALIGYPRLIVCDEPTGGLDPLSRRIVWAAIRKAATTRKQMPVYMEGDALGGYRRRYQSEPAILITSHDMPEVEALADTVGIMAAGGLVAYGDVLGLKRRYGSGYLLTVVCDGQRRKAEVAQALRGAVEESVVPCDYVQRSVAGIGAALGDGGTERQRQDTDPCVTLIDDSGQSLVYAVNSAAEILLPSILHLVEEWSGATGSDHPLCGHVCDYALCQSSLEEVFLRLSHSQHSRVHGDAPKPDPQRDSFGLLHPSTRKPATVSDVTSDTVREAVRESEESSFVARNDPWGSSVSHSDDRWVSESGDGNTKTTHPDTMSAQEVDRVLRPPTKTPRVFRGLLSKMLALERTQSSLGVLGVFGMPCILMGVCFLLIALVLPTVISIAEEQLDSVLETAQVMCDLCNTLSTRSELSLDSYVEPCYGWDGMGRHYICTQLEEYNGEEMDPGVLWVANPDQAMFNAYHAPTWVVPWDLTGGMHGSLPPNNTVLATYDQPLLDYNGDPMREETDAVDSMVRDWWSLSPDYSNPYYVPQTGVFNSFRLPVSETMRYSDISTVEETSLVFAMHLTPPTFEGHPFTSEEELAGWLFWWQTQDRSTSVSTHQFDMNVRSDAQLLVNAMIPSASITIPEDQVPGSPSLTPTIASYLPPSPGLHPYQRVSLGVRWNEITDFTDSIGISIDGLDSLLTDKTKFSPPPSQAQRLFALPDVVFPNAISNSMYSVLHTELAQSTIRSELGLTQDEVNIRVGMKPFPYTWGFIAKSAESRLEGFISVTFLMITIFALIPSHTYGPVLERMQGVRAAYRLNGVNSVQYWTSLLLYNVALSLSVHAFLYVIGYHVLDMRYFTRQGLVVMAPVLACSALSTVCVGLFISVFFKSTKVASLFGYVYSMGIVVFIWLMVESPADVLEDEVRWWYRLGPSVSMAVLMFYISNRAFDRWDDFRADPMSDLLVSAVIQCVVVFLLTVLIDSLMSRSTSFRSLSKRLFRKCHQDQSQVVVQETVGQGTLDRQVSLDAPHLPVPENDVPQLRRLMIPPVSVDLTPMPSRSSKEAGTARELALRSCDSMMDADVRAERVQMASGLEPDTPVVVSNVQKFYPPRFTAVRDVAFHIPQSSCFALLGPNGAGKSTTIDMLTGNTHMTSGSACILGHDVGTETSAVHKCLGYCPQHDVFVPTLTVRQHLELFCRLRGVQRDDEKAVSERLAGFVQLDPAIDTQAMRLSGGMRRRLSLALALIGAPPIVVLDEPSTGLDPFTKRAVWQTIDAAKAGKAMLLTTHSTEEASALAQRIGIMVAGQMRCIGTGQHLKRKFGSGFTLRVLHREGYPVDTLTELVVGACPAARLTHSDPQPVGHCVLSRYAIPGGSRIGPLFQTMLTARDRESREREGDTAEDTMVAEFSVDFSSLEQVMLKVCVAAEPPEEDVLEMLQL